MKQTRQSQFKNLIGPRVRLARVQMVPTVSQDDLCGRLARRGISMSQASLSKLESRKRSVLDYEAVAIAKALRVSIAWLYGEKA